jgi:hypothetical protein
MFESSTPDGNAPLSFNGVLVIVFISSGLGLLWAAWNWLSVTRIDTQSMSSEQINSNNDASNVNSLNDVGAKIAAGATEFLKQ